MAFSLGNRNFATGGGGSSALARAKKAADLYIRTNTDSAGNVSDPAVYQYANSILAPYADDLSIQQKVASYNNKIKELDAKSFDQDNTLGVFKQNVQEALYATGNVIRDPSRMALFSASALDNVVNSLDVAIARAGETNKSTDKLEEYRKTVTAMANGQRDLVNQLNSGTNPQSLDGYGYFVKTNPIDGSLIGAALLPVNSAPDEVKHGMKRIDNTIGVNGSKIPVYLPVTKDASGQVNAKLYGNTWSGSDGDSALPGNSTPNFSDKESFDIRDESLFPIKKMEIAPGGFGRVVSGVKDGQTQFSYFFRGQDGKTRQLDQAGIDAFKQDPIFAEKINGYVPMLSPDEVKGLGSIERVNPSEVPKWSSRVKLDSALAEQDAANKNLEAVNANPFFKAAEGVKNAVGAVGSAVSGFFANRKNQPNKPDQAPQGTKTSYSTPDVVASGKDIFAGE